MISPNNPNQKIRYMHWDVYLKNLYMYAHEIMRQSNNMGEFKIDEYNVDIIKQMYLWAIRCPTCRWNVDRGIYLCGAVGCGKTTLMKAFLKVVQAASGYYIPYLLAPVLYEKIQKEGLSSMKKNPIFIDEVGREQLEIYVNGVRIRPIEDLMSIRYEYGSTTFFTSNFKIETLSQGYDDKGKKIGYGSYIGERIREMCNIVVYPGKSRRQL